MKKKIEELLGMPGKLVSLSKSCGPPMTVYNSNLVVDGEVVWHGDIDLDQSKDDLLKLANKSGSVIEIYDEHSLRIWGFEHNNDKERKKALARQRAAMLKKDGMMWTSLYPNQFADEEYEVIRKRMEEIRNHAIKIRLINAGVLTPAGTDWKWYNIWFYNYPYKLCAYLKSWFYVLCVWPYRYSTVWNKIVWYKRPLTFIKQSIKEIGYQRFPGGLLHCGPFRLYEKDQK